MKRLSALLVIMTTAVCAANAQMNETSEYQTALGVKVYPGAISLKHFFQPNRAGEALGYISRDGFRLTGLFEQHYDINSVEGLKWFIGGGGHFGIWSDAWKTKYPDRSAGFAFGVDGVIGLDYKIRDIPLNISFDWQPSFNLIGYTYFEGGWGGLGVRYTF